MNRGRGEERGGEGRRGEERGGEKRGEEVIKWTDVSLHHPPFKARCLNTRRPLGGCQVHSSERD
jgi:hypothetical protein